MYIYYNKLHGCHDIHDQVHSFHHFVNRVIRLLPIANHHRALSHRTLGDLVFKLVNHKGNALVHELVQIGMDARHFRHHANLKPKKRYIIFFFQPHTTKQLSHTHRHPVIDTAMAVVTMLSTIGAQTKHHLIPLLIFAQVLCVPRDAAFRQPLKLLHHLLPFVHRVKALHPKHNLDLDFQRKHIAKRFVLKINQSSAIHLDTTGVSSWRTLINRLPSTNHRLAPGPEGLG